MNSIFFTVVTLLLLTAGVLLLMQEFNKTKVSNDASLVLAGESRIYRFSPCDN